MKGSTRIGIQGKIETPQGIQVYRLHYYHDSCVTEETKRKLHTAPNGSKQPPKKKAKKDTNCNTSTSNAKKPAHSNNSTTTIRQLKPKVRKQLEKDLRQLRTCYATTQGNCEEYKIFSNKSLTELLTKLPRNNEELSQCWGIKGKRIKQYGKSILTIINMYLDKEQQQQGSGGNGRRRVQMTIPMSPPSSRRTTATVNNNSSASAAASSVPSSAATSSFAAVVTPARPPKVKKEDTPSDDDEEIVIGPTISVEDIVRSCVQEAEARGEVLEIL